MWQIKGETLLFPQHPAPEIVVELRGDKQGGFAAMGADRSRGDGIVLQFEPFTGPNVDLRNHGDAASLRFRLNGEQDVVDPAFTAMAGCECDQFERRRGTVDQCVHDGNGRGFDPLSKNLVVLKTRQRKLDDRAEVFHTGGERLDVSISQVTSLANDGLLGVVWKTDGGLLVAWGVAKIYFRVARICESGWHRRGMGILVDARCRHSGGSTGSDQSSDELAAIQGHLFSSRNPNCGTRLVRALSESASSSEINHFTILFAREKTKIMI